MNKQQKERYSRQIRLPGFGETGQQALVDSRVLMIGMGGLGSPAAMYLAASGIGQLVVSDYDRIEPSNLQRQIIHREKDTNELKAQSAKKNLQEINPACDVIAIDWELDEDELNDEINQADVVLDCCDNFQTRFQINRICFANQTPLVSGAAIRMEGQIATWMPHMGGPCYQCLYPAKLEHTETCAMEGILAPVVGIIGTMQALQTIQVLTGKADHLQGKLMLFDATVNEWQKLTVKKDPACPVCS